MALLNRLRSLPLRGRVGVATLPAVVAVVVVAVLGSGGGDDRGDPQIVRTEVQQFLDGGSSGNGTDGEIPSAETESSLPRSTMATVPDGAATVLTPTETPAPKRAPVEPSSTATPSAAKAEPTSTSLPTATTLPPTATAVPATAVPPTAVPPTTVPPTAVPPTAVPATAVPPTAVPPTAVPATAIPPTAVPPTAVAPTPTPSPPTIAPAPPAPQASAGCTPGYSPCIPPGDDVDCAGGSGNGPRYVAGPIQVTGSDPYRLDGDNDGIGCE